MANATLRFRINNGAVQTGTVSDTPSNLHGKTVSFSAASTAGWRTAARWMIEDYPDGYACPDGWTGDAGGVYYYLSDPILGLTPPDITLPDSSDITAGMWGKFEFRLLVNGTVYSQKCGIEIISPNGVHDLAFGEQSEFDAQRAWTGDQKKNLRTFDGALAGGAPTAAKYLIGEVNASLPNAVVWTTVTGQSINFNSSAVIPCTFSRVSSGTNAALDCWTVESGSSGSIANGFGVSCLYRAQTKDVGRVKFILTDVTSSSEDTEVVIQLRSAGAALSDAFLLSHTAWQVAAVAGSGSGYLAVDNAGNITVGAGGAGAPTDAPYLTVGAVSGLSNEVDITAISSTLAFASTSVVPVSLQRTDAATNTVVDVEKVTALSAGTAAAGFGSTKLYRAKDASGTAGDIGRHGFRWTDAGALTAESEYIIQLRHAGDGLQTKLTLGGDGRLTVANLTLSGLATGYLYASSGVVSIGATQPAPSDAAFLTVGPVTGLSAEVDVNAINTTVVFGSTSVEPTATQRTDASTNTVINVCSMRRSSAGTASAGIGGQIAFEAQNTTGGFPVAGYMSWRLTTATAGSEASELGFWTRTGGGALAKNAYLSGTGDWTVVGSITGASIKSDGAFDRATAGTMPIGTSTATAITVGKAGVVVTIPGGAAFADVVTINKDGISSTPTRALEIGNDTISGTQLSPFLGFHAYHSGGTRLNAGMQLEVQSSSRAKLVLYYGTGATVPTSTGTYFDNSDSNFGSCVVADAMVIRTTSTTGYRFDSSNNRGGVDLNGNSWIRIKSYNTKGVSVETGADSGGTGGVERLIIDGSGKGRAVFVPHVVTSSGNAVTFPLATSQHIRHTTTEDTTVSFTGATPGLHGVLEFVQGNTGYTITMPTSGATIEYDAAIQALTYTGIVSASDTNKRTLLFYYVTDTPVTRVYIYGRSVSAAIP